MCSSLKTFCLSTPLGTMKLQICKKGFHELKLTEIKLQEDFMPEKDKNVVFIESDNKHDLNDSHTLGCIEWLNMYFSDPSHAHLLFKPPLCQKLADNEKLKRAVFEVLYKNTKPGELLTYTDLAKQLGEPGKARQLGRVLKSNPILIFVPTHRVICQNNQLGSFSYDPSVKSWLLKHEGVNLK